MVFIRQHDLSLSNATEATWELAGDLIVEKLPLWPLGFIFESLGCLQAISDDFCKEMRAASGLKAEFKIWNLNKSLKCCIFNLLYMAQKSRVDIFERGSEDHCWTLEQ
jgi:hypothetical protein